MFALSQDALTAYEYLQVNMSGSALLPEIKVVLPLMQLRSLAAPQCVYYRAKSLIDKTKGFSVPTHTELSKTPGSWVGRHRPSQLHRPPSPFAYFLDEQPNLNGNEVPDSFAASFVRARPISKVFPWWVDACLSI